VATDVSVNNAGSTEKWPFQDRTLVPTDHVRAAVKRNEANGKFELQVAVKRTETVWLSLRSGSQLGLAIYTQVEPNSPRWLSVFEPYRLILLRRE